MEPRPLNARFSSEHLTSWKAFASALMDHSCETIGFWKSPASPVLVDKLMNGETLDDFKHPKPPKRLPCPRFVASFKTPLIISTSCNPFA